MPNNPKPTEYPEHEKLKLIRDKSQAVGEFLDWLSDEKEIRLCEYEETRRGGDYYPTMIPRVRLLAEFFDIDQDKLEDEKRHMLNELRRSHGDVCGVNQ